MQCNYELNGTVRTGGKEYTNPPEFVELYHEAAQTFDIQSKKFDLEYTDENGNLVAVTSDEDLLDSFDAARSQGWRSIRYSLILRQSKIAVDDCEMLTPPCSPRGSTDRSLPVAALPVAKAVPCIRDPAPVLAEAAQAPAPVLAPAAPAAPVVVPAATSLVQQRMVLELQQQLSDVRVAYESLLQEYQAEIEKTGQGRGQVSPAEHHKAMMQSERLERDLHRERGDNSVLREQLQRQRRKIAQLEAEMGTIRAGMREKGGSAHDGAHRAGAGKKWPAYKCMDCDEIYPSKLPYHGRHARCASCRIQKLQREHQQEQRNLEREKRQLQERVSALVSESVLRQRGRRQGEGGVLRTTVPPPNPLADIHLCGGVALNATAPVSGVTSGSATPHAAAPCAPCAPYTRGSICSDLDALVARASVGSSAPSAPSSPCLDYPCSLSPQQRRWVHLEAQQRGLGHASRGGGGNRSVQVWVKNKRCQRSLRSQRSQRSQASQPSQPVAVAATAVSATVSATVSTVSECLYEHQLRELREIGFAPPDYSLEDLLTRLDRHGGDLTAVINGLLSAPEARMPEL